MSKKSVFCIVQFRTQAEGLVDQLRSAGFSSNDISVLLPDQSGTKDFAHKKGTKAPEGAATGAGTGLVVGGALGWLVGIGTVAIPGVGPFIAAGPILAALSGAAVGGTIGGITGALVGLGIPEFEAKRYEGKIHKGNILLSVHAADRVQLGKAQRILRDAQVEDLSVSGEEPVSAKMENHLGNLFLDTLADIYYAEKKLVDAMPAMAKAASHEELREAFGEHLRETKGHVAKVEQIFSILGQKARTKRCEAIDGLIKEADRLTRENSGNSAINAALISGAQKIEHYEIASYGCLREWAGDLGHHDVEAIIQDILDEEKAADQTLTGLARLRCNESAERGHVAIR